jgi:hypothetical protein
MSGISKNSNRPGKPAAKELGSNEHQRNATNDDQLLHCRLLLLLVDLHLLFESYRLFNLKFFVFLNKRGGGVS